MPTLATLAVVYVADLSDLETGTQKAISLVDSFEKRTSGPVAVGKAFTQASQSVASFSGKASAAASGSASLASAQAKAAEAAKRVDVAEASAALALKKASDLQASGKASAEQIAVAQARAALAAEKVSTAEASAAMAMEKAATMAAHDASAVTNLASASERVSSHVESLGSRLKGAGGGLLDMASKTGMAVMGIKALVTTAISAGQGLFTVVASAEQSGIAFTTLLGSAKAASAEIQELNHFADITPFEPGPVQQYAAQLIGMKVSADKTIPIMTSLGDALFAVGKGSDAEMASVVDNLGKISIQGRMTWEDIVQFGEHGIDALGAMSLATGKSTDALHNMASNGGIPAKMAIDALTKGIELNPLYKGGMAKQANSLSGIFSTLSGYVKNALVSFLGLNNGMIRTGSLIDTAKNALKKLGDVVSSKAFQDFAQKVGTSIADTLSIIVNLAGEAAASFAPLITQLQPVGEFFQKFFAQILNDEPIGLLIGAFANLGKTVGNLLGPLLSVLDKLSIFSLLGLKFKSPQDAVDTIARAIGLFSDAMQKLADKSKIVGQDMQNFANWLNKGSFAADALKDSLIGVATAITTIKIGQFLATLPALLAGLTTWAAEMGVIATETIIATWPFFLIGVVVAAVVAGIILAIQHWGEISKWLQDRWKDVSTFFSGLWSKVVGFFSDSWKKIQGFFGGSGIGNWFHDRFTEASNGAKSGWQKAQDFFNGSGQFFIDRGKEAGAGAKAGLASVGDAFHNMAMNAAGSMIWLYNHNYLFQALVDTIRDTVVRGLAWLQVAWTNTINWLVGAWQNTATFATTLWQNVAGAIQTGFFAAIGFVAFIWGAISAFFAAAWTNYIAAPLTAAWANVSAFFAAAWTNWIVKPLTSLWASISSFFANAWANWIVKPLTAFWAGISGVFSTAWTNWIAKPLQGLWDNITGFFGRLRDKAVEIGSNIIHAIVTGITSAAGAVGNAIQSAISNAMRNLYFHDIPGVVPGHASGIMNSAAGHLAMVGERGPELMYVPRGADIYTASQTRSMMGGVSPSRSSASSSSDGGSRSQTLILEVDRREWARMTMDTAKKEQRLKLRLSA